MSDELMGDGLMEFKIQNSKFKNYIAFLDW